MLARPMFKNSTLGALGQARAADVAVVVDHSLSMGRRNGDKTLLQEAQSVVDRLTSAQDPILHGGSTLSVVLAEHAPRKLTTIPKRANDLSAMADIQNQMHALKDGVTDCNIPAAIEAAREVVSHGTNLQKVVVVVSDEQQANWNISDLAAWRRALGEDSANGLDRHVQIHNYPLSPDNKISNISVESIEVSPTTIGVNRPVEITAKVSNSSAAKHPDAGGGSIRDRPIRLHL
jgi:hypothetical protein